ncbi:E3 ubiquitin-protein ligase RNF103-like isoform X2 [Mytilus edulis]|uniref:E3 ubiquitin-protein ligase RNF103-like isoform X2 n=1 Tax=Mytilus edulis TaxID=6550 RepID=UPI0039EED08E
MYRNIARRVNRKGNMLVIIRQIVIYYDVIFFLILSRALYLSIPSTSENNGENTISVDRLVPNFLTNKKLFDLLDNRMEIYQPSADRSLLVTLAKTKVVVEKSASPKLADLESLTISDLKQLLDQRGIMYNSRSTKHDLIGAVIISGPVTIEALAHMKQIGDPKIGAVHEFNDFNIEETVEKHNESIFLINIWPQRLQSSYFNKLSWKALQRKLSYMDFKFGELDCGLKKRICMKRKWNISTLYLYTPGKENTTEYYITDDYSVHSIFSSIQNEINYRVKHISSWETFTSSKWAFYYGSKDKIAIRIILFTNMTLPPMFLSSLSVKYRDTVNIGMVNIASHKGRRILRQLKQKYWPLLLVVTKRGIFTYGKLQGEHFTYQELDFYLSNLLQDFQPIKQWYHKLPCFLDPTLIGLIIVWFKATHVFSRVGIIYEERNRCHQHDGDDVDNNHTMETVTHEAEQLRIINQKYN